MYSFGVVDGTFGTRFNAASFWSEAWVLNIPKLLRHTGLLVPRQNQGKKVSIHHHSIRGVTDRDSCSVNDTVCLLITQPGFFHIDSQAFVSSSKALIIGGLIIGLITNKAQTEGITFVATSILKKCKAEVP